AQTRFLPADERWMLWDYARGNERDSNGSEMTLLEVRAFGAGRVQLNGQAVVSWDGILPRSLFFFLVDKGLATRTEIFNTFWPNLSVREATNVFHVTKRKISEVLGIDLTVYMSGFYHISPKIHLSYDVALFNQALPLEALTLTSGRRLLPYENPDLGLAFLRPEDWLVPVRRGTFVLLQPRAEEDVQGAILVARGAPAAILSDLGYSAAPVDAGLEAAAQWFVQNAAGQGVLEPLAEAQFRVPGYVLSLPDEEGTLILVYFFDLQPATGAEEWLINFAYRALAADYESFEETVQPDVIRSLQVSGQSLLTSGQAEDATVDGDVLSLPEQEQLELTGSIGDEQVEQVFRFEAAEGTRLTLGVTAIQGNLDTFLTLRASDGDVLVENDDHDTEVITLPNPFDSAIVNYRLPDSGVYAVVVTRFGRESGTSSGNFLLVITQAGNPLTIELPTLDPSQLPEGVQALQAGQPLVGVVTNQFPAQRYAFQAQAGAVITLSVSATSGNLDTLIELSGPEGDVLVENDDHDSTLITLPNSLDSAIVDYTLPITGVYEVLVTRFGRQAGDSTGVFELSLSVR
ncbi:MAG: hypothetical protein HC915_17740, partial [Anaerolineae bacterium]|nr:hypothetical protein [Anaerolineae bacterium]